MAWYDIFYKVFNLKDRTMEHNNFNNNNFNQNNSEDTNNNYNPSISEAWQGADIIGPSGFGVTNLDSYIQREDYNRHLNEFRNSKIWKDITKGTKTNIK